MGSKVLFKDLGLGVFERQKIGLLGPNGAGKSTLLKIMAQVEPPDSGQVTRTKGCKISYVGQSENFPAGEALLEFATQALVEKGMDPLEAQVEASVALSQAGFEDFEGLLGTLSGGWQKRLSLALAFAQSPDLLILDEPTNHMDWEGILWLESYLKGFKKAFILVSHDRTFLENLCHRTIEIHGVYREGYLSFDCGYEKFLQRRQEYISEQQKMQATLENKARREVDWLRAGVKARTTKSQSRIKEAHQLLDRLSSVQQRNRSASAKVKLDVQKGGKRSKKFLAFKDLSVGYGERTLIEKLDLELGPRRCVGILGRNGCGKTSLLKVIAKQISPLSGNLERAHDLKVVYFDQKRDDLPQDEDLMSYLGDGSDSVTFKGESTHVAAYASRFLFPSEKLKLKISQLSGGEQARLLIAKLLLQPADVLILDEPTNDLDIESIEVLEDFLREFPGLVLLVSHDRTFLRHLCRQFLALSGRGHWRTYPDLSQWLRDFSQDSDQQEADPVAVSSPEKKSKDSAKPPSRRVHLTYKEKRFLETIEKDIEVAEAALDKAEQALAAPDAFKDPVRSQDLVRQEKECRKVVEDLYQTWQSIEEKQKK